MTPPLRATYRLQMGRHLTFAGARELVPYLARLGISHLYLSPIWKARSGSTHGYDVVDPNALDARLGPRGDLEELAGAAREHDMGIVCDVVPNHMAASHENAWWWDVLEHGRESAFADVFDIDWGAGDGRIVLPVLADEPERVLDDLVVDVRGGHTVLRYHDRLFPLTGEAPRRASLELLDDQPYRLVSWRTGRRRINYRRFFDIDDLVATRMDDAASIERMHALAVELLRAGTITGLRVDHIDGLRDPAGYLDTLAGLVPDGAWIVVEKILGPHEDLPDWACAGTTGYELSDAVETAGVDPRGAKIVRAFTASTTGAPGTFRTIARRAKREALETLFASELDALTGALRRLAADGGAITPPLARIRRGLVQATTALDVYRTYVTSRRVSRSDRDRIEAATEAVTEPDVHGLLRDAFEVRGPKGSRVADRLDVVARWQQLCAPAAAKGVEDTALYRDVSLVSRNEVGSDPAHPSTSVDALHTFLAGRRRRWPLAMSGSSTHDSKRGEDVRARLDVLAEVPERWEAAVRRWTRMNARARRGSRTDPAPDATDELLVYQTLVGSWPLAAAERDVYIDRVADTMHKSIREAKRRTSWSDPDTVYEDGVDAFVRTILAPGAFLDDLDAFARPIALHGAVNALARLVVKAAAPGVPDVYQGAELWHLRLVDPDNRAPVDFAARTGALDALEDSYARAPIALAGELLERWPDGRVKLFTTACSLARRAADPELFTAGAYVPLAASGTHADNVIAFARRLDTRWAIAIVPRLSTQVRTGAFPLGDAWGTTSIRLPDDAPEILTNAFTNAHVVAHEGTISAERAFGAFPVALLTS